MSQSRKHEYSQHFLKSSRLVAELIGHSNIRKNDTVVDLGAGSGIIASVLARRAKRVIAVEIEERSLKLLTENLDRYDNVEIIAGDMLTWDLPTEPYKIFANIPFSLSAQVVKRITTADNRPKSVYLIVQKQFAQKLMPSERHFTSQLGASIGPWWQVRIRKPLRKTDFTPPPAVDTVLLELKPREEPLLESTDREEYASYTQRCFAEQKFFAKQPLTRAGIDLSRKPSELSIEQWVKLFTIIKRV